MWVPAAEMRQDLLHDPDVPDSQPKVPNSTNLELTPHCLQDIEALEAAMIPALQSIASDGGLVCIERVVSQSTLAAQPPPSSTWLAPPDQRE